MDWDHSTSPGLPRHDPRGTVLWAPVLKGRGEAKGTVENDTTSYPPPSIPVNVAKRGGKGRGKAYLSKERWEIQP